MTASSSFHQLLLPCLLAAVTLSWISSAVEAARPRVLLAPASSSRPQSKPQPGAAPDQYLSGHNQARAAVGVAPLRWSAALGSEASRVVRIQQAEKGCEFADLSSSRYGANQAWASYAVRATEAVRSWVEEGKFYNYGNNSCAAGHPCGTYTQVVWRNSAELGCAQATCAAKGGATSSLTLCLYDPPGNILGQKPY
ncbi:STS14 protein-like [Canna indica]|uniref:STS14 protein-like n=1 Tax=Canna indica TaxID=4628 RepID=A0AAQ3KS39_9LILI|nr:STS14 protein-like [Canna indica]